jgi:hypothetical protein
MKLKKLSIICIALTGLLFTSNASAEEQQSFIRKVRKGGFVSESIQMKDGSYVYLNGRSITEVKDLSGKKISELSLTFVDIPYSSFYQYADLNWIAKTLNGFVLVGSAQEYGGDAKGIVIKVSSEGQIIWKKQIGLNGRIGFDSVIPTADGGFIVTGWTDHSDMHAVLIKFSSRGDILWSKGFDSLSSEEYFLSTRALNGGVILVRDLWNDGRPIGANVIRMNDSGNIAWAVTLEMKEFSLEEVTTLSDQGYLLAGKADTNKLLLVRLNADGTVHSKAAYSLEVPDFSVSYLAQTPDGGIAIAGILWKERGSYYDSFFLKINDRQELTLQKRLGFPKSQEAITSVIAKKDGSYLLFGSTYDGVSSTSDTLFVGLNSDGTIGCNFSHNLRASKVLFEDVNHKRLALTANTFSVLPAESLELTSKRLSRPISNGCMN